MNKIAVITGASGDVGSCIALELIKSNYTCILVGTSLKKLQNKFADYNRYNIHYFELDFEDHIKIKNVCEKIIKTIGIPDIIINCAGIGGFQPISELTINTVSKVININLVATMLFTQMFIPYLIKQNAGQIINIESIAAIKGFSYGASYVASKFGLEGFSQVLREELQPYNIKVCTIKPGLINTSFFKDLSIELPSSIELALSPDDISYIVKMIINQSDRSNICDIVVRPLKYESKNTFYEILSKAFGDSNNKN